MTEKSNCMNIYWVFKRVLNKIYCIFERALKDEASQWMINLHLFELSHRGLRRLDKWPGCFRLRSSNLRSKVTSKAISSLRGHLNIDSYIDSRQYW